MASWFRPTAANYFGRIGKGAILDIIAETRQQPNALAWPKLKKAKLAAMAETVASEGIWLPEVLKVMALNPAEEVTAKLAASVA